MIKYDKYIYKIDPTFVAAAKKHFGVTNLSGKLVLTSGLGGMGGAQPLSVTMAGGVAICIEIDENRVERRIRSRYLDKATKDIDEAIKVLSSIVASLRN